MVKECCKYDNNGGIITICFLKYKAIKWNKLVFILLLVGCFLFALFACNCKLLKMVFDEQNDESYNVYALAYIVNSFRISVGRLISSLCYMGLW